jgi:hypothetical protein
VKHGGPALTLLSLLVYLAVGGSCSSSSSTPYDAVDQWLCVQSSESCTCAGGPSGTEVKASGTPTVGCGEALDCCFVKDHQDGTFTCTCIATPPDVPAASSGEAGAAGGGGEGGASGLSQSTRCVRAATDYDTTTVVAHCPPVTLDSAGVCALTFESCDPAYLRQNGLVACCDGLTCQADGSGQKICVVSP